MAGLEEPTRHENLLDDVLTSAAVGSAAAAS
jgi:hypothetical protein